MNTAKILEIVSSGPDATSKLGEQLGQKCSGGEIFLFASDLGGGKTTMVKGLARGLGSTDQTGSPSFAISKIYNCRDGIQLHHYDFYRLTKAGLMAHELGEVLEDPKAVIAIEWGDVAANVLPKQRIDISIVKTATDEDIRTITISYPDSLAYILKDLT